MEGDIVRLALFLEFVYIVCAFIVTFDNVDNVV